MMELPGTGDETSARYPGAAHESNIDFVPIDKIKNRIRDNFTGNCISVRRVHYDVVLACNVTPSFRSVWSVFGDVTGMGGLVRPVSF